ncbi:MAG: hypothetical protein EAZ42_12400 [Verrucomicrobia bacterium]|nr:MAG: hypothetical protein EAZ42_12400 [Verrucomicrobiota bacterium]
MKFSTSFFRLFRSSAFFLLLSSASMRADQILTEIEAAKKAYEAGDAAEASLALNQALALLNEKKSGSIGKALPDKIGEWAGAEIEDQSAGMAMLGGGGVMLSRSYTKGEKSASISLSADSPMLATFLGMMGNPAMATAMGMKMHRLGDEKAMINEKEGSATMIYKNRFLIQIQNSELSADDLLELIKGVDLSILDGIK